MRRLIGQFTRRFRGVAGCRGRSATGRRADDANLVWPHAGPDPLDSLQCRSGRLFAHRQRADVAALAACRAGGRHVEFLDDFAGAGHFVGPPAHVQLIAVGLLGNADRTVGRRELVLGNLQQLAENRQRFLGPGIFQVEGLQSGRQRSLRSFDAFQIVADRPQSPHRIGHGQLLRLGQGLDRSIRSKQLGNFGLDVFGPDLGQLEAARSPVRTRLGYPTIPLGPSTPGLAELGLQC